VLKDVLKMQAEVLAGPERRRRWSAEEKARIVAESDAPGAQVAEVARRYGVSRALLYTWRRTMRRRSDEALPAVVVPATPRTSLAENGVIEIALPGGVHLTLRGRVDAKRLRAVVAALRP
jgi:transposase